MNRPLSSTPIAASMAASSGAREPLSALVDGELSDAELDVLWQDDDAADDPARVWSRYQLIGDVLRNGSAATGPADPVRVQAIMQRVQQEAPAMVSAPVASVPEPLAAPSGRVMHGAPAANDEVFRWKMLAGFACLAMAAALAWNLTVPGGSGAPGPQLALQTPAPLASESTPVVVQAAEQGPMLRDPRLEELLVAHRQAGGMSALQMPAGFLRSATFEMPGGER